MSPVASPVGRASGPARAALALGTVGTLGEELLAALGASPDYRVVHVAMTRSIASSAPKYRPWLVGAEIVAADDAFVCVSDDNTFIPPGSPLITWDAAHLIEAARLACAAGARRLVVVSPLSALLQMNAASHTLSSVDELALLDLHIETLLIVRPTRGESADTGRWFGRTVRTFGKMVMDIMLPARVQALRPRTAALAILTAVQRSKPGVHVIGAGELLEIVAESMPTLLPPRAKLR